MRTPLTLASALLLGATSALVPSPASAAPGEFGNGCETTSVSPDYTFVMAAGAPSNPLPVAAQSAGVVTKAQFNLPPNATLVYPQKLKIVRSTGVANQYTVTAESPPLEATAGTESFNVRLPVAGGDLLGLYGGDTGTLYCTTASASDVIGGAEGDSAPGSAVTYLASTSHALPVVVTLEPDRDEDGFGDITQDKCPQSAAFQGECPVVDSFAASQGGSIIVVVGIDNKAKVKVTGKARVNGKVVKLGGKQKTVKPGELGRFKVAVPSVLRAALAKLPSSKFIKVTFTASVIDVRGRKSKDTSSVKLRGTR
ncbi:hypothetical protein [Nocardioides dilutus]